jgi:hypothetical protein
MADGSSSCWLYDSTNMAHCDAGGRGRPPHQANANQSPQFAVQRVLGDEKVPPLTKSGVSFLLESNSGIDVPFKIEVIVH